MGEKVIRLETIVKKEGTEINFPIKEGYYSKGKIQCIEGVPYAVCDSKRFEVKKEIRIGIMNSKGWLDYYTVI